MSRSTTEYTQEIAWTVSDCAGNIILSKNPDKTFYAASTIKLAVLIAAMRLVDAGELALDQPVEVSDSFESRIPGAGEFTFEEEERDTGMPAVGTKITLNAALGRMIRFSSNAATNMIVELMGINEVNAALSVCGARSSKFERLISDHFARDAGYTHQTTSADLTRIMHSIVSGDAASEKSTELMLRMLRGQQFPVIATVQDEGIDWGSKSGWDDGIHHDVAFIGSPNDTASYVLAVCTRGYDHDKAAKEIKSVSRMVRILIG